MSEPAAEPPQFTSRQVLDGAITEAVSTVHSVADMPRGVAEGVALDLAKLPSTRQDNKNLSKQQVADKWGLAIEKVDRMDAALRESGNVDLLRTNAATRCGLLTAVLQNDLLERLLDKKERAKINSPQMAKMIRDLSESSVSLMDGKAPTNNFDLRGLVENMKKIEERKKGLAT